MENTKEMIQVSFKIPRALKEIVQKYVKRDLHVNMSDFFRDALREKVQRDALELYKQLFQGGNEV